MFNVYFTGSYFPTGWGGGSEPAAPGALSAVMAGSGSVSAALRGSVSASMVAGGSGAFTGALEAVQGGSGEMGMVAVGTGAMLATLQALDANPPAAGGGFWPAPPVYRRKVYADAAMVCWGSGSMLAAGVSSGVVDLAVVAAGLGHLVATPAVTERQEIHGFSLPTFQATRKAPRTVPPAPAATFRPVVYADMALVCAGAGSMVATGATTQREDPPAPYDDADDIALALLLLEAA